MKYLLRVVILLSLINLLPLQALALSQEQLNVYNSGINFFDVGSSSTSAGGASCLSGSDNETRVWNYLIGKKLTAPQAAGIMGNLAAESASFEPKLVEYSFPNSRGEISEPGSPTSLDDVIPPNSNASGQPGYGIAQWTSPNRKQGLQDLATKENLPVYDLGLQLDYLWQELTTNFKDLYTQITQTSDQRVASDIFGGFEGYGTDTKVKRSQNATDILTKYGSDTSGGVNSCDTSTGSVQLDPNFTMIKLNPPLATPGGQITPQGITLHWWGNDAGGNINSLVSSLRGNSSCGGSGCSVQIGITDDGKIYQMTKNLTDLAYHAIGGNQTTFGIEIEGAPSDFGAAGVTKNPAKFNAVVATVKYLIATYNLPLTGPVVCDNVSGVHAHKDYNSCPNALIKEDIDDAYYNAVMQKVRE